MTQSRIFLRPALCFFYLTFAVWMMFHAIPTRAQTPKRAANGGVRSTVLLTKGGAHLSIQSVDVSHFPDMSVIFSALDSRNDFVSGIKKEDVSVLENDIPRPILSLELLTARDRAPIDVVFVVDVTGSMQPHINKVKENMESFANSLRSRGLDFKLGLVTFRDTVDFVCPQLTDDLDLFNTWVSRLEALGGGDTNENALEGIHAIERTPLRNYSEHIAILISDAPYHQLGEQGDGTTRFTTLTMGAYLVTEELGLYSLTPKDILAYDTLTHLAGGEHYDIYAPYLSILDGLLDRVSHLYTLKYRSQSSLLPDSVSIGIVRADTRSLLSARKMAVLEPGRRLVFEELNFPENEATLTDAIIPELERVVRLMYEHKTLRIRIEGHADASGTPDRNYTLSGSRAESVKAYLVHSGVVASRIETTAFGSSRPIATNATPEGRKLNRRIEFVVLQK